LPTLTVDGRVVTVPAGTTIIQAAEILGIEIPRYCYHPALSIAGNCRICQVEVETASKLQISCQMPCADGMVVHTNSERVQQAQKSTLEFLLANHPLDCPVCDQSGECYLQDYYMDYGQYDPIFRDKKVKKKKALPISKYVMLDQERCILCSRCVRYTDEITETHEFGIFDRGDHSEVNIVPGESFDENKYQGNVVDICPVGALTDRDFRFKCRVWYLGSAKSVCPGCSMGCNINVEWNKERPYQTPGERVMRLKPRYNPEVNKWWMCDEGRYGYKSIDQNRILTVGKGRGGEKEEISWDNAFQILEKEFERYRKGEGSHSFAIIASPQMTNEELFAVRKFFAEKLKLRPVAYDVPQKIGTSDAFLMKGDKNPNTMGARLIIGNDFGSEGGVAKILKDAATGKLTGLWVFSHDLVGAFSQRQVLEASEKVPFFVFSGTNWNKTAEAASLVLPTTVYAEKDGTFTNYEGRVQRIFKALTPLGESRQCINVLQELALRLGHRVAFESAEIIFKQLSQEIPAFAGLTFDGLGEHGATLPEKSKVLA